MSREWKYLIFEYSYQIKKEKIYWESNLASTYPFLLGLVFSDNPDQVNLDDIEVIELRRLNSDSDFTILHTSKE